MIEVLLFCHFQACVMQNCGKTVCQKSASTIGWTAWTSLLYVPITSLPRQYMHYTLHSYLSYKYVNIITSANKAEVMWHYYREVHRKLAVGNSDLVDTNRIKSQLESNFREVKSSRLTLTWGPFHSNKGQGSCSSLGSTWGHYSLK